MKDALKLGVTLALYAAAACFALALVNNFTAPVIQQHAIEKESAALKVIFPTADAFEKIEGFQAAPTSTKAESFYKAKSGSSVLGYAVKASGPTYENSTLVAGFLKDMKIAGVHILETKDSPGFGQKAADAGYKNSKGTTFYGQFAGVDANAPLVLGTDYEAISGATITSTTMGKIISDAAALVKDYIQQEGE